MPIIAKRTKLGYGIPPEGLYRGVLVDVVDKGVVQGKWGANHKVELRWQLAETDPESNPPRPFMVIAWYTLSLHEKSRLCGMVELWRGKKYSPAEADQGLDLESLIGCNCQIQVAHGIKDEGEKYAVVQAVLPPAKGVVPLRPDPGYVRVRDRERAQQAAKPSETIDDSDIPF
jgi:hypothetical protein